MIDTEILGYVLSAVLGTSTVIVGSWYTLSELLLGIILFVSLLVVFGVPRLVSFYRVHN